MARYLAWWKRSPLPGVYPWPAFLRALLHGAPPDTLKQRCDRLRAEVEPRLRVVIAEAIGVRAEKLVPEASLRDDLAVDSLDLLDVLIRAEAEFGIVCPEGEVDAIRTFGDVVALTTALVACRLRAEEALAARAQVELRIANGTGHLPRFVRIADSTPYDRELIDDDVKTVRPGDTVETSVCAGPPEPTLAALDRTLVGARLGGADVRTTPPHDTSGHEPRTDQGGDVPALALAGTRLATHAVEVVNDLRAERELSWLQLTSHDEALQDELHGRRSDTNVKVGAFRTVLHAYVDALGAGSRPNLHAAAGALGRLPAVRTAIDDGAFGPEAALDVYTEIMESVTGYVDALRLQCGESSGSRLPPRRLVPASPHVRHEMHSGAWS